MPETAMPPTDAESIQRARLTLERPGATDAECRAARATLRTAALLAELSASASTR